MRPSGFLAVTGCVCVEISIPSSGQRDKPAPVYGTARPSRSAAPPSLSDARALRANQAGYAESTRAPGAVHLSVTMRMRQGIRAPSLLSERA
ncbi:hypothetical protein GCM10027408_17700 [Microbacterium tumbae]